MFLKRLEVLYAQHGPGLLAFLRRQRATAKAAEDLLQETFVQAARRPERLAAARSPRAWLFGIARNLARNTARRTWRYKPLAQEPEAKTERQDPRLEAMSAAIEELPAAQREVLELRLHDGLCYAEIAELLEIPIGTVRSRLHHAIRNLRAAIEGA